GRALAAGRAAPEGQRTLFASFAQVGSAGGLILSMLAFGAISTLSKDDMMSWGWRVPFLASSVLLIVGFVIRASVSESPEFEEVKKSGNIAQKPLREALKYWPLLLLAIGANVYGIAGVYFSNIFMISYATQFLSLDRSMVLHCMTIVAVLQFVVQLAAAFLAQRFGTTRVLLITGAWAAIVPFVMLPLVHMGSPLSITVGVGLATLAESGYYSVVAGFVSGIFVARIRYTAISIAYQVCGALAGGLTPLVATIIAQNTAPQWWPLALQYTSAAILSSLCVWLISRRVSIDDAGAANRKETPLPRSVRTA
ncbi:MFS transporter, partial [Burkholderia contaminans]